MQHVIYHFKAHSMGYTNSITDDPPDKTINVNNPRKGKKVIILPSHL